jgi:hypothetical protein
MTSRILAVVNGSSMPIGSSGELFDDDTSQAALLDVARDWR